MLPAYAMTSGGATYAYAPALPSSMSAMSVSPALPASMPILPAPSASAYGGVAPPALPLPSRRMSPYSLPLPGSAPLPIPTGTPRVGTPSLPLAVPLGTRVPSIASGSVTTFPMTGGVAVRATSPPAPVAVASPVVVAAAAPAPVAVVRSPTSTVVMTSSPTSVSAMPRPLSVASALPAPTGSFSSYAGAIAENSIDDLLLTKGYLRLDVITLDSDREKIFYIKAINPVGDIVFIEADRSGALTVQLQNRTVVKVSPGSAISQSVKIKAAECAESAGCRAAFQCEGEFCIVQRADDGKIYEGTFVTTESASDKKITPLGSPVAYPIITLSEIEANSDGAIVRVRKATMEIQAAARVSSMEMLNKVHTSAEQLTARLNRLRVGYGDMHDFRDREVKKGFEIIDRYRRLPQPLSEVDKKMYKDLVDKLYNLNLTYSQLINYMKEYTLLHKQLDELVMRTDDSFYGLYREVRRTYDADVSKELRKPGYWGLPAQFDKFSYEELLADPWPTSIKVGDRFEPVVPPIPDTPATAAFRRAMRG